MNDRAWGFGVHGHRHGNAESRWQTHPPHAPEFPSSLRRARPSRHRTNGGPQRHKGGSETAATWQPERTGQWSWDDMRSRVRPPQVCVHSGPIARTRHGSWGEEAHFYIFTPPGSDRPPTTADALRDLKERLQATGGHGNTRLSFDWEPRGKHGRSLHDLGISKRNVTKRKETVRRWKRHWTGTPATGGAGFSHTIPPGHAPATLDSWRTPCYDGAGWTQTM